MIKRFLKLNTQRIVILLLVVAAILAGSTVFSQIVGLLSGVYGVVTLLLGGYVIKTVKNIDSLDGVNKLFRLWAAVILPPNYRMVCFTLPVISSIGLILIGQYVAAPVHLLGGLAMNYAVKYILGTVSAILEKSPWYGERLLNAMREEGVKISKDGNLVVGEK